MYVSKETYTSVKRDLLQTYVVCRYWGVLWCDVAEVRTSVRRDLHYCQKRPTLLSKETYTSVKRDLH
jgi:hypothetical protein